MKRIGTMMIITILLLCTGCGETGAEEMPVPTPTPTIAEELGADYSAQIDEADLREAEVLARMDYEAWVHEDYCLRMEVLEAAVNEEESVRLRMMYENFQDGWSRDYLTENFVVVAVTYDCELDHSKTFLEDGRITKQTLLIREDADAAWQIWDYSMT